MRGFVRDEGGLEVLEYGLVCALIVTSFMLVMRVIGLNIQLTFSELLLNLLSA